ncbi:MAG: molybdate ABC transporter substrate-binding protein [Nitrospira sp. SB0677_bin_15]|nr:molybdate ABC transporter substrate-binding protein [Nitrospira sp. SB0667_bin_9]MYD30386.1 molybdate ABC transporter substrate-binding protein [Nitrospira sp. SB0661_bin_20]MYG40742.1 molybdate ABC transporter substrate-binding protein [Nitrospira sp. SB0677_bin_15]MYH01753.1 molybdate ABC transporter substrate-binding protein [Nitrospira sp. SB0675_bin_23]MYJ23392.1 molybdate ABC transporter substrate-binding protein [Nitrospira sp. SB0673_bin_12]
MIAKLHSLLFLLFLTWCPVTSAAEEVRIAVAANFRATLDEIVTRFEQDTGHTVVVSSGSSGKLYAQIRNGAPFDVFFSADVTRPKLLEEEGFAVPGSRFTYAVGRLTLWHPGPAVIEGNEQSILLRSDVRHVAIANPKTAPYGAAAKEALQALGLWEQVQDRLVRGENIGQTFHFVFSQNAQLGFVALSQVLGPKVNGSGSRWDVPVHLYAPIRQQAVLLRSGQRQEVARAFLDYVKDVRSRNVIERFGYGLE